MLWLQDVHKKGKLNIVKVKGSANPADLLTKRLDCGIMRMHMKSLMLVFEHSTV